MIARAPGLWTSLKLDRKVKGEYRDELDHHRQMQRYDESESAGPSEKGNAIDKTVPVDLNGEDGV